MTIAALIVAALSAAGILVSRIRALPVSEIEDGLVLPSPSDPRWRKEKVQIRNVVYGIDREVHTLVIGKITVTIGDSAQQLFIGHDTAPKVGKRARRYAQAVVAAYQQRIALEAMEED